MAAESGTAPEEEPRRRRALPVPPDWRTIEDEPGLVEPASDPDRVFDVGPKIRERLQNDPDMMRGWATCRDDVRRAMRDDDFDTLNATIDRVATEHGPQDIPVQARGGFLFELMLKDMYGVSVPEHPDFPLPLSPVRLIANVGPGGRPAHIRQGEIAMVFAGAQGGDRAAFNDLIVKAQRAFGYPINKGGRPRRQDDPEEREQSRTAAKLAHWCGFSNGEIAEFFGWKPDAAGIKRASEYVGTGSNLLTEKLGDGWQSGKGRVPGLLAKRAVALNRSIKRRRQPDPNSWLGQV